MPRPLIVASVAMNIAALGFVAWAALGGAVWLGMTFVIKPHQVQLATQHALLQVQPGDTVFLGDSITEGGIWHELFPATATRQRGIGGDTTAGVLARLDPIAQAKPRQVFLLIGTNDLFFGVSEDKIVANVVQIVDRLLSASPETSVFVQSVLPRAASYQQRVESLNAALEKAVAGKATWINLYPLFLDPTRTRIDEAYSNDALHLLGKGYIVWRDAIEQHVSKR